MKRTKVSAIYEGYRKKRSKEDRESSRRARMNARARRHGIRQNNGRDHPYVNMENMITVKSTIKNVGNKRNEEGPSYSRTYKKEDVKNNVDEEVVNEPPKVANEEAIVVVAHENEKVGQEIFRSSGEINTSMVVEQIRDESVWWDDWPSTWSYEEDWMRYGIGNYTGEQFHSNFQEEPWEVNDIWNLRNIN